MLWIIAFWKMLKALLEKVAQSITKNPKIYGTIALFILLTVLIGFIFVQCGNNGGNSSPSNTETNILVNLGIINNEINKANEEIKNANKETNQAEYNYNSVLNQDVNSHNGNYDNFLDKYCSRPNNATKSICTDRRR